jgi:hypothetical protein
MATARSVSVPLLALSSRMSKSEYIGGVPPLSLDRAHFDSLSVRQTLVHGSRFDSRPQHQQRVVRMESSRYGMSDPQTIARALMNLTPEQRAEVLVLYDKLATLGV